jgi:hypothetical protein
MMMDMPVVVLRAMFDQAEAEGRHLFVDEAHLGHAVAVLDGYDELHLTPVGGDGHLRVEFR